MNSEEVLSKAKEAVNSSLRKVEEDLKHFREKSHLVRKQLKDIFYQSKMFHGKGLFTKSQLKILDTILDHLGSVQDHEVLISNLKNFRKTILFQDHEGIFNDGKRIEERAKKKKDDLLEKAYQSTEELLAHYEKNDPGKIRHRNSRDLNLGGI